MEIGGGGGADGMYLTRLGMEGPGSRTCLRRLGGLIRQVWENLVGFGEGTETCLMRKNGVGTERRAQHSRRPYGSVSREHPVGKQL